MDFEVERVERRQASQVSLGLSLVIVGLIFLGQRLGWGPGWNFGQLWPLVFIGMGTVELVLTRARHIGAYFWIFTGVILLLDRRGLMPLSDSWPLFLVAGGVWLIFRPRPSPPTGTDHAQ